eukprot:425094_1
MGCVSLLCSGEACNANADIPDNLDTCLESEILNEYYSIQHTCAFGSGITLMNGLALNYNILKCTDNSYIKDLSSCTRSFNDLVYTYNMRDYIRWVYGCACNSLSYVYNVSNATVKQLFEAQKDDLILNNLPDEDPIAWMQALNCNIDSVECDFASGDVYIKPKTCSYAFWQEQNGHCVLFCDRDYLTYEYYFHPQHELSFDIIKTLCPDVSIAADAGYCSNKSQLIWPEDECGCPYCSCINEGWIDNATTHANEYLFGYRCSACYCGAVTGGYGAICFSQFGEDNYPFGSYETIESFHSYQCPPEYNTICTNNGQSYIPGQSFWDVDTGGYGSDIFCICDPEGTGQSICANATADDLFDTILSSNNTVFVAQFLKRCGRDLQGCLNANKSHHIVPRSDLSGDCPICGCDQTLVDTVYIIEEIDHMYHHNALQSVCRSCQCHTVNNVSCTHAIPYDPGTKSCPPGTKSCYQGESSISGDFVDFGTQPKPCAGENDSYCAYKYVEVVESGQYGWARTCQDRVLCEAFGVTDGTKCVRSNQTVSLNYGCGILSQFGMDTLFIVQAMGCCAGDDCNNGDFDVNQCEPNAAYDSFISDFYECMSGTPSWDYTCVSGDHSDITCDNVYLYMEYIYGCACSMASDLYTETLDPTLLAYLEDTFQDFMRSISFFTAHDVEAWNQGMGCNIVVSCDVQTGLIDIYPTLAPTTADPTTVEPTTAEPSRPPTPFTCDLLTILVRDDPYPDAVIHIGGQYALADSTINQDKWMWERSDNVVIEYADDQDSWIIKSGFVYLVHPDIGDPNELPPYSQSIASGVWTNWTDTFTGVDVQLMLL